MSSNFTIATVDKMLELALAKPGDVAQITQAGIAYMKNDLYSYSTTDGWQIPAVNIAQATENFSRGLHVPGVSVNGFSGTPKNKKGDAKASATQDNIYKFTGAGNNNNVLLTVKGVKYRVSAVTFNVGHNQIPYFTAIIDGKVARADITPRKPSLSELNEVRTELMKYIYNSDVTVALAITAASTSDSQKVDIKEWIISGVGNTSINARGNYAISVVASHPLIMADTVHTTVFNSQGMSDPATDSMSERPNLHLKAVEAIEEYARLTDDVEMYEQTDGTEINFYKFSKRILKATAVLKDKVEWNNRGGSDLPKFPKIEGVGDDVTEYLDDILWHTVVSSSSGNHSPLSILMMFTQPDAGYATGIDGWFNDAPVVLSPQVFWGKPTGTIYEDEIADMLCPGESSYPVAGVICPYPMQTSVDATLMADTKGYERVDSCGAYLKPAENGEVGPVYRIYLPPWLSSYATYSSAGQDEWPEDSRNKVSYLSPTNVSNSLDYWKDFKKIAEAWAKNKFLEMYSSGKRCSLQTRLMMTNPNFQTFENAVRTGENVCIKSRLTDEVLFYFFVLEVSHVIDAHNGAAYTNIVGAYVRPPNGIPAAEISAADVKNGIDNIIFGAKGGHV